MSRTESKFKPTLQVSEFIRSVRKVFQSDRSIRIKLEWWQDKTDSRELRWILLIIEERVLALPCDAGSVRPMALREIYPNVKIRRPRAGHEILSFLLGSTS